MPKYLSQQMLTCSVVLTPKQALALRDLGVKLEYRCPNPDCSKPVIAISKGRDKEGTHTKHISSTKNEIRLVTMALASKQRKLSRALEGLVAQPNI
jgi:hypothetical protein